MKIHINELPLNVKLKAKHWPKEKKKEKEKKEVKKTNEYFETWALLCDSYISFLTLSAAEFHNYNQLETCNRKTNILKVIF